MSNHPITQKMLDKALSYKEYSNKVETLFERGETTNGDNSDTYIDYTKLNIARSQRIDKRGKLTPEAAQVLQEFSGKITWVVITEGWCGDSAQSLPYLNIMAGANEGIDLKIILRDEHPEVMDAFLTNGTKSIPKLVMLNSKSLEVIGEWGPRPVDIQEIYLAERKAPEVGPAEASKNLHLWYAKNKGASVQHEISVILMKLKSLQEA